MALSGSAAIYSLTAYFAVHRWGQSQPAAAHRPPAAVLKPLCGVGPETYECLRSFCEQDYPEFQIIFGVADENDPAIALVRKLQRQYPHLDLQLVVDRRQHGTSRKVSNLINIMSRVRHGYLVLSDSDVRVSSDYLTTVMPPLLDSTVGIVTCAYRAVALPGVWSALGALFINEWFIPSVKVAAMSGSRAFAFGATIAIKRAVLDEIGGFHAIVNHLADDYRLGELTRRAGLRTVLSDLEVEVWVVERSFRELVDHELRWLRTIRAIQPLGYAFTFITFSVPAAILGMLLGGPSPASLGLLGAALLTRSLLHLTVRARHGAPLRLLLLPARDLLNMVLWTCSFWTRRVRWRDVIYSIERDGSVLQSRVLES